MNRKKGLWGWRQMRKIFSKISKTLIVFGILIVNIRNKVFGVSHYVAPPVPSYGIYSKSDYIKIISYITIPIFWIIGNIVYYKKEKEEKNQGIGYC